MESSSPISRPFVRILESARGGCATSIGELLESCRGYLLVIANRNLDTALKAKFGGSDLVQDTLLRAHAEFAQFRGQSQGEFLAWLQRILLNSAARVGRDFRDTAKRDLAREVPLDPSDASHHGIGGAIASNTQPASHYARVREDEVRLRAALAKLSETDQRIVELRNRDLLTFADIGLRLGMSTETARRTWSAALERLHSQLVAGDEA